MQAVMIIIFAQLTGVRDLVIQILYVTGIRKRSPTLRTIVMMDWIMTVMDLQILMMLTAQ